MPKEYLNNLNLNKEKVGNERRIELLNQIFEGSSFFPLTVEYKDIDEAFRDWVKSLTIVSDEGKEYPTMMLFSNQRFSEYSQSWQYVDDNQNLLLNFKTVTRENNPKYGNIQSGLWNIPGNRFYTMKKKAVLDDNGSQSFITLKMRQPVAVDLMYKVSVFTTRYTAINEFNTLMNRQFAARQCYIQPNGHFMPMTLENINDESQYNINDRQFYSQTYQIKVMAYIITEDDFRIDESPMKLGVNFNLPKILKKKATTEIEEFQYVPFNSETACGIKTIFVPVKTGNKTDVIDVNDIECNGDVESEFFYKPMKISIVYPSCCDKDSFTMPSDLNFVVNKVEKNVNIGTITIFVNGEKFPFIPSEEHLLILRKNDDVKITINRRQYLNNEVTVTLAGYCPDIVYSEDLERMALEDEEEQVEEEYVLNHEDCKD